MKKYEFEISRIFTKKEKAYVTIIAKNEDEANKEFENNESKYTNEAEWDELPTDVTDGDVEVDHINEYDLPPQKLKINTIKLKDQYDEEFIYEVYREDKKCERDRKTPAYIVEGDPAVIPFCRDCLNDVFGKENIQEIED